MRTCPFTDLVSNYGRFLSLQTNARLTEKHSRHEKKELQRLTVTHLDRFTTPVTLYHSIPGVVGQKQLQFSFSLSRSDRLNDGVILDKLLLYTPD